MQIGDIHMITFSDDTEIFHWEIIENLGSQNEVFFLLIGDLKIELRDKKWNEKLFYWINWTYFPPFKTRREIEGNFSMQVTF